MNRNDFDLRGDESLQLVIRAHLYAEQLIFAMISERLAKPDAIDLDRLTFPLKVRLAVAMGLMAEEVIAPLLGLNKLRNRFAHETDYRFTSDDKIDLLSSIPAGIMEVMLTDNDGQSIHTRDNVPLERILLVLVCLMEARRRNVVEGKAAEREAQEKNYGKLSISLNFEPPDSEAWQGSRFG
jgi:hypothetical protein